MTEPPVHVRLDSRVRLDKWLWHARFVKTRALAVKLCESGIRVDGVRIEKPGATVRPGQVLTFALGRHVRVIELVAIGDRRGPAAEARSLYRDLAPPAPETAMPSDIPF
jgi:ribosome-associated heat shock protein Hsp15